MFLISDFAHQVSNTNPCSQFFSIHDRFAIHQRLPPMPSHQPHIHRWVFRIGRQILRPSNVPAVQHQPARCPSISVSRSHNAKSTRLRHTADRNMTWRQSTQQLHHDRIDGGAHAADVCGVSSLSGCRRFTIDERDVNITTTTAKSCCSTNATIEYSMRLTGRWINNEWQRLVISRSRGFRPSYTIDSVPHRWMAGKYRENRITYFKTSRRHQSMSACAAAAAIYFRRGWWW